MLTSVDVADVSCGAVVDSLNGALDLVCLRFSGAVQSSIFLFEQSPEGFQLPCVYINGQISAGYGFKYRGKEKGLGGWGVEV